MKIRYAGQRPRDVVGPPSFTAEPGGEYEVSDRLGEALCEQKWFEPVLPARKPEPKEKTP